MRHVPLVLLAVLGLLLCGLPANAQMTIVVPAGTATVEGNSSTGYPWNTNNTGGHRIQYCYDSSNFAGITMPILIQQIRWRANGSTTGTWAGGNYPGTVIDISSAAFDQASLTTTFATNHGLDRTNVFTGTAVVDPGTASTSPNIWYVTVKLQTPFLYDPTSGNDLLIDITLPGARVGGTSYSLDAQSTGSLTSRMYSFSSATSPTGSFQANVGAVIEVSYVPAAGLYANFDADIKEGSAPLKVQFTDKTFTSDPGGVLTWAWDFDGDSKIDSTLQNPIWTYPTQNKTVTYDVTLTVTDASHPQSVLTKKAYITVDPPPRADFSATPTSGTVLPGNPPMIVQFTDLSVGANTWAWDFNGDTVIDSTLQNPAYPYIAGGRYSVTLSVTGVGGNDKITKTDYIYVADTLTTVLPTGLANVEGNSANSFPWNTNSTGGHRIQFCYDSTHFTGITSPILIQQLRWRANGSTTATWTGGTYDNTVIDISTAAFDHASLTTTFATNHGPDKTNVFTGTVTVDPVSAGSIPNVWYITVRLQTPFIYDPTSANDLLIDITLPGGRTGGTSYSLDVQTTGSLASRMYNSTNANSATGTFGANHGAVIEIGYMPATGLYPEFSADVTAGSSPLKVTFTDKTYTSDPGGVTSWAWDFDGDSKIDSTLQNPIWTYPSVAKTATYDVTLTVTDAANPGGKFLTKKAYITVDPPPVADFSATPTSGAFKPGGPPVLVRFTDLSIGANTWAWDFDGDNKVDSTLQNPLYPYIAGGLYSVTLSVTGVGGNDKITKPNYIKITDTPELSTIFLGGNGGSSGWMNMFDVNVKSPGGIWITSLDVNCSTYNVPVTLDVYIGPTTYVGNELNAAPWTKVASGTGMTAAAANLPTLVDIGDIYLPPGSHAIAILYTGASMSYTNGTGANQSYSNTDIDLTLGCATTGVFSGSIFTPRVWNGTVYYITKGWSKFSLFGEGCTGTNGVPRLVAAMGSVPKIGSTVTVNLSNMPAAGGSALALVGLSKATLGGLLPLPFDLALLGGPGCSILSDILLSLGAANVGGLGSYNLALPNDPVLIGGYVTTQALVLDPGANTLGLTTTNGGELHIGN